MNEEIKTIISKNEYPPYKPFFQMALEVCQLPLEHQVAFFGSCCERLLPIYSLVSDQPGWGNISILNDFVNCIWKLANTPNLSFQKNEEIMSELNTINLENIFVNHPDDEEMYVVRDLCEHANEVHIIIRLLYKSRAYINNTTTDLFLNIFKEISSVISVWVERFFTDLLTAHNQSERSMRYVAHQLTQAELEKELSDIFLLKEHLSTISDDFLITFRNQACLDGQSMLGSMPEVRAACSY
jgi:hypothetical protein